MNKLIGTLIGSFVEVIESKNKTLLNVKGRVIKETKNTITIKTDNKEKTILKNQVNLKNEN